MPPKAKAKGKLAEPKAEPKPESRAGSKQPPPSPGRSEAGRSSVGSQGSAREEEPRQPPPPPPKPVVPYEMGAGPEPHETKVTFLVPRGAAPRLAKRPVAVKGGYFELKVEEPPAVKIPEGEGEGEGGSEGEGEGEAQQSSRSSSGASGDAVARDAVFAVFYSPKPEATAEAIAQLLAQRLLEWADMLFTPNSPAAPGPEAEAPEALQVVFEGGNAKNPSALVVWVGEGKDDQKMLKDLKLPNTAKLVGLNWNEHSAAKTLHEFDLNSEEVLDGSWYLKERKEFVNADFDLLQDVEILCRSFVEAVSGKLAACNMGWDVVTIAGFGKGAGVVLYALLSKLLPKQIAGMLLCNPVAVLPAFWRGGKQKPGSEQQVKLFHFWGTKNACVPQNYIDLLTKKLENSAELQYTPDSIPDGEHVFDKKSAGAMAKAVPSCIEMPAGKSK